MATVWIGMLLLSKLHQAIIFHFQIFILNKIDTTNKRYSEP